MIKWNRIKIITYFITILALVGCAGSTQKSSEGTLDADTAAQSQHIQDRTASLKTIEEIAAYFFSKEFGEIEKDTALKGRFEIRKSPVEEEGVEWDSYEFVRNNEIAFTIENNWQSKTKVDRITFVNTEVNTNSGISADSKFGELKKQIDTLKIPNMPDGYLAFFDKKLPCMSYCFEDTKLEHSSKGVGVIHDLPDNLKIYSIVLMGCNF